MSEADKMFEELGYKKVTQTSYSKRINKYTIKYIDFEEDTKGNYIDIYNYDELEGIYIFASVNMQELQAINKKIEELCRNEQ